jgi:hypothetical protein
MISLNKHQTLSSTLCTKTKPSNTARMSPRLHSSKKFNGEDRSDCSATFAAQNSPYNLPKNEIEVGSADILQTDQARTHIVWITSGINSEVSGLENERLSGFNIKIRDDPRYRCLNSSSCQISQEKFDENKNLPLLERIAGPRKSANQILELPTLKTRMQSSSLNREPLNSDTASCLQAIIKMRGSFVRLLQSPGDQERAASCAITSANSKLRSVMLKEQAICGGSNSSMDESCSISIAKFSWME